MRLGRKNNEAEEQPIQQHPTVENKFTSIMPAITSPNNMNDVNRIALGCQFEGDLATENDIRIDGDFKGRLYCAGRLVVGEKATVKGDIFCANVDFSGSMTGGNIYARETLSLKGGCSVQGDLYFQRFQVELDAKFTGSCKVLGEGEFDKVSAPVSALLK